jgi:hypothetical protein
MYYLCQEFYELSNGYIPYYLNSTISDKKLHDL